MTKPAPEGLGPAIECACGCGGRLTALDGRKRPRRYLRGHHLKAALAKK